MNLLFRQRKPAPRPTESVCDAESFPDVPTEHLETYQHVRSATMTSAARVYALCDAVDYVCNAPLQGDIVECGVWKGGSMMAAARTLLQNDCNHRRLWMFDTFSGMTAPAGMDVDYTGRPASSLLAHERLADSSSIWCRSPIEEVQSNIESTGYPNNLLEYVVGDVAETLLDTRIPTKIALLRLDTDWYESTKLELESLFPRLEPGGVLIIDDYGHWKGCRRAVDEYFADNNIRILLNRIDYTGRIGIKNCGLPETDEVIDVY